MINPYLRQATWNRIKQAGPITDLVQKSLQSSGSFRDQFLKMSPGPQREQFIYDEVARTKPPISLVPVTVDGPAGIKITYRTMPDYLTLDGIRVPMSGTTAQKVADLYGMKLPTAKMSQQIYDASDYRFRPTPLSAGGVIGGRHYSGQEVVQHKISDSDSAVAYSDAIEAEMQKNPNHMLAAGYMKDILSPEGDPKKLSLYGWYGKDGRPLQYSAHTPHDTQVHSEYGAGTRLVSNDVTITSPSGKTITTTLDKILNDPNFYSSVSDRQGVHRY